MKRSLVPKALRDPAGNPPFSLAYLPPPGSRLMQLAGVIVRSDDALIGPEIRSVMGETFRRVREAGFTPDDIVHVRIIVGPRVDLNDAETVQQVNGAYTSAFHDVGVAVATAHESVFPCREAFGSTTLFGHARFEAVPTVLVEP